MNRLSGDESNVTSWWIFGALGIAGLGVQLATARLEQFDAAGIFHVVLAVEVLYYVRDVKSAIDKLFALGRSIVVSYTGNDGRSGPIWMRTARR